MSSNFRTFPIEHVMQLINRTHDNIESLQVGYTNIRCDDNVTLIGIYSDKLKDAHVSEICKKLVNI